MPFLKEKHHRQYEPHWKKIDRLTKREGFYTAVYGKSIKEKYTGWFKDNKKDGKGTQTYEDGTVYEGDWLQDKRHGQGQLSVSCDPGRKNLVIYKGEWKHGYASGLGVKYFPDGSWYKGDFRMGLRHGIGSMQYKDGQYYSGEWHKDARHGFGKLINADDENYYEGNFRKDKKCGPGRFYYLTSGQIQVGIWYDDFPEVAVILDDEGIRREAPKPTEFPIPVLTVVKNPRKIYLERVNEVMEKVNSV